MPQHHKSSTALRWAFAATASIALQVALVAADGPPPDDPKKPCWKSATCKLDEATQIINYKVVIGNNQMVDDAPNNAPPPGGTQNAPGGGSVWRARHADHKDRMVGWKARDRRNTIQAPAQSDTYKIKQETCIRFIFYANRQPVQEGGYLDPTTYWKFRLIGESCAKPGG